MRQICSRVCQAVKRHAAVLVLMLCVAIAAFTGGWFAQAHQVRQETLHYLEYYTPMAQELLWNHYLHMGQVGVQDTGTIFQIKNTASIANTLRHAYEERVGYETKKRLQYDRPCIRYLDALYFYVSADSLRDPEQIWEYCRPYFDAHYDQDLWVFLDNLDAQLTEPAGQEALAAVEEYARRGDFIYRK